MTLAFTDSNDFIEDGTLPEQLYKVAVEWEGYYPNC